MFRGRNEFMLITILIMEKQNIDLSDLRINRNKQDYEEDARKKKKTIINIIIFLFVIAAVYGVYKLVFKDAVKVSVVTVNFTYPSSSSSLLTASGYIVPQRKASIASKGTGRLVYLGVEEGDKVKKGQIIALLESDDVNARLNQAMAQSDIAKAQLNQEEVNFDQLKKEFKRSETLFQNKVITESEFDIVKAQYLASEARLNSARATIKAYDAAVAAARIDIENTVIRAPFDGTVLTKDADVGEIVAPFASSINSRGAVVTMADMTSLQLEADVSESYIERIKIEQPCEIILDAYQEKRYRGVVWKIVPTADRAKATILTKIKFLEVDERVLPEMSAKVSFLTESIPDSLLSVKPKLTIPMSAIKSEGNKRIVYKVNNNIAEETEIITGEIFANKIEVTFGLKTGDVIVNNPPKNIIDKEKLVIEK